MLGFHSDMKAAARVRGKEMATSRKLEKALSSATLSELLKYDPVDGFLYWRTGAYEGRRADVGGGRYRQVKLVGVNLSAHRVIWCMQTGRWPQNEIDHIDRDSSNNRFENLRECTPSQNNHNTTRPANSTSGYRGVSKVQNRYAARICIRGEYHRLGWFDTPEEAAIAIQERAHFLGLKGFVK